MKRRVAQSLKHAAGFDRQDKIRVGPEPEALHRTRHAIGAAAEPGAVDLEGLAGFGVRIHDGQGTGHRSAVGFRVEA